MKQRTLKDIRRQGRYAGWRILPPSENPYEASSPRAAAWREGYEEAKQERLHHERGISGKTG